VGLIQSPDLNESSGLAASRRFPGTFWSHNDKGNRPVLFAISRQGATQAQFLVAGKTILDWEDIALDAEGRLYIADTGNNEGARMAVAVHRLPEPNPATASPASSLSVQHSWDLRFPNAPFDSEGFFVHDAHGYLVSKVTKDRRAELFRFPLAHPEREPVVLEFVAQLPVTSPVTGADLSPDGRRLALVCKSGVFSFLIEGNPARAAQADPARVKFKHDAIEAVCFVPEGLLVSAESREIFLFDDPALRNPGP
jgi:hypothetical protein